jgi:secreted trypsin-like serine protease
MVRKVASLVLLGVLAAGFPAGQPAAHAAGGAPPAQPVVGGDQAPEGRFPWVVHLSTGCGGALTAPRVVLTAGHCVNGVGADTSIEVIAGSTSLRSRRAIKARSVRVVRAQGFVDETRGDDWALIKLNHTVSLPTLVLTPRAADERGPFTIMGWGQTEEGVVGLQNRLRYAQVPVVSDSVCAAEYRTVNVTLVRDESICAGKPGVDTCQGDSGGPLVRRVAGGGYVQVGIVSFGLGCGRRNFPGVYTQLSKFRAAIKAATLRLS